MNLEAVGVFPFFCGAEHYLNLVEDAPHKLVNWIPEFFAEQGFIEFAYT
jgi:hypothetical protein